MRDELLLKAQCNKTSSHRGSLEYATYVRYALKTDPKGHHSLNWTRPDPS